VHTSAARVTPPPPAGDLADPAHYVLHADVAGRYQLKVPQGWAKSAVAGGVRFISTIGSITVTTREASSEPTLAQARAVTVPRLRGSEPGFALQAITALSRPAGHVVLIHFERDGGPDGATPTVREDVQLYEFFRNGTELDVTVAARLGSNIADACSLVTDSVTWAA
jgi:hypothetical protein